MHRYHSYMIILHWLMALMFIGMLVSGFVMSYVDLAQSIKFGLYQLHKSFGVILLIAFIFRVLGRLILSHPSLPASLPALDITLAKLGHFALYALMFIMPFSGWLLVSSSSSGFPTLVFGQFEWPHIPGIAGEKVLHERAELIHFAGAIALILTVIAHVGAVVKHAHHDKLNLLTRLWWGKS